MIEKNIYYSDLVFTDSIRPVSVNRLLHWFINVTNGLFKFFIKNAFVYLLLLRLVPICSWIVPRIRPETDKSSCGCITLKCEVLQFIFLNIILLKMTRLIDFVYDCATLNMNKIFSFFVGVSRRVDFNLNLHADTGVNLNPTLLQFLLSVIVTTV